MNSRIFESANAEEARIRAVYGRLENDDPRYSWFNSAYQFMVQQRERQLLAVLCRYEFAELQNKTILEVGCGTGQWLRDFVKWGAQPKNVTGIDLLVDRLAQSSAIVPAWSSDTMR